MAWSQLFRFLACVSRTINFPGSLAIEVLVTKADQTPRTIEVLAFDVKKADQTPIEVIAYREPKAQRPDV